eukprot:TRINITY_DN36363_c0_g1_i1.p1 TRINITY_DN36363_c0_g1~~TRINITY_DN36363_c0_g1_i1.p1  ORF type:complete len:285 (-),score=90.63 TRINITY_DN36363_c0_g1_i1:30-884(-)
MGGDGGQVIDRATMVKTKGWGLTKGAGGRYTNSLGEMSNYMQQIQEDRGLGWLERRRTRLTSCRLSQQALQDPVVACRLGNLYNKEALISALLNKSIPKDLSHIRALKDVKPAVITWKEAEKEDNAKRMVCPISREELDVGSARSVVIWSSGVIVSAKALKEMKLKECPVTNKPFDAEQDLVPLIPDDDELEKLRARLPEREKKKRKADAAEAKEGEDSKAEKPTEDGAKKAKKDSAGMSVVNEKREKSGVYAKLFVNTEGDKGIKNGARDAFGTPSYAGGSRI